MTITYEKTYNDHPINTDIEKQQGCDTTILDRINGILRHSTKKHNKVFCTRFDLHYPKVYHAPADNKHIQTFSSKFNKQLKRDGLDPVFIWVRERSREKRQHYHLAVMCNGNKIQFPHKINNLATRHWQQTIGSDNEGLVTYCNKSRDGESQISSYNIRRGSEDYDKTYDECFHRLSYLAKVNTKETDLNGTRRYGGSKIPKL